MISSSNADFNVDGFASLVRDMERAYLLLSELGVEGGDSNVSTVLRFDGGGMLPAASQVLGPAYSDPVGSGTSNQKTGVTAGTYTNATIKVDEYGRVTEAASGTGGSSFTLPDPIVNNYGYIVSHTYFDNEYSGYFGSSNNYEPVYVNLESKQISTGAVTYLTKIYPSGITINSIGTNTELFIRNSYQTIDAADYRYTRIANGNRLEVGENYNGSSVFLGLITPSEFGYTRTYGNSVNKCKFYFPVTYDGAGTLLISYSTLNNTYNTSTNISATEYTIRDNLASNRYTTVNLNGILTTDGTKQLSLSTSTLILRDSGGNFVQLDHNISTPSVLDITANFGTGKVNLKGSGELRVNGTKVIGLQQSAIANLAVTGSATDAVARSGVNAILAALRTHGLIAT